MARRAATSRAAGFGNGRASKCTTSSMHRASYGHCQAPMASRSHRASAKTPLKRWLDAHSACALWSYVNMSCEVNWHLKWPLLMLALTTIEAPEALCIYLAGCLHATFASVGNNTSLAVHLWHCHPYRSGAMTPRWISLADAAAMRRYRRRRLLANMAMPIIPAEA